VKKFKNDQTVSILNNFLINSYTESVLIYDDNPKKILKEIKSHFKFIQAAGGIVRFEDKILLIKRLNKWDLPKGKLEDKESFKKAAIRETMEETGVNEIKIDKKISCSFHIYPYKKGFALKKTNWYLMDTLLKQKLAPQEKEKITEAKWVKKAKAKELLNNSYLFFKELIPEL